MAFPNEQGGAGRVPADLAEVPVGPGLAQVLARIDVAEVSGYDTVEVLAAQHRQMCHERARFLLAMLETGLRAPGTGRGVERLEDPGEFACEEARAALMLSRRRAGDMFRMAHGAFLRLPLVGKAMLAGELDESRALAFVQWTRELNDPQAAFVCDELLPEAAGMTVGALIDQIKRLAIALDPDWAERRYREAVNERRVVASRNDDGSANVSGINLPVDRAKAGCDRIERLARACKRAGDGRLIDHIRADLYLGMIDGALSEMSGDEIVAYVHAHPFVDVSADADAAGDEVGAAHARAHGCDEGDRDGGSGRRDGEGNPAHGESARRDGTRPNSGGQNDEGQDDEGQDDEGQDDEGQDDESRNDDGHGDDGQGDEGRNDDGQGDEGSHDDGPSGGCKPHSGAPVSPGAGGVALASVPDELRVELTTLLGRDQHPGELPGLGHIPAAVARGLARRMTGGEWRFVICGDNGRPICSGITTRRPCGVNSISGVGRQTRGRGAYARRCVVEIQVRASDLSWIDAAAAEDGAFPVWAEVIDDIAARVGVGDVDTDAAADEVRRRAPGAGLRRWLEARDRCCAHPACRVPASACDQDHRVDYAQGGPTTAGNLCPLCRHDHRLKTEGGWSISKITTDGVEWVSGLGRSYSYHPPPVITANPVWVRVALDATPPAPLQAAHAAAAGVLGFDDVPPF